MVDDSNPNFFSLRELPNNWLVVLELDVDHSERVKFFELVDQFGHPLRCLRVLPNIQQVLAWMLLAAAERAQASVSEFDDCIISFGVRSVDVVDAAWRVGPRRRQSTS